MKLSQGFSQLTIILIGIIVILIGGVGFLVWKLNQLTPPVTPTPPDSSASPPSIPTIPTPTVPNPPTTPEMSPDKVIKQYIQAQNNHDVNQLFALLTDVSGMPINRDDLEKVFNNNPPECIPFYNILSAELVDIKDLPLDFVSSFTDVNFLLPHYEEVKAYYVAIRYQLKKETQYYLNGTNFFLFMLGKKNNKWEICQISQPPVSQVVSQGFGFNTEDEEKYMWVEEMRQEGKWVNYKGEEVSRGLCE